MLRLLSNLNYITVPEKALNAKVQLRLDLINAIFSRDLGDAGNIV